MTSSGPARWIVPIAAVLLGGTAAWLHSRTGGESGTSKVARAHAPGTRGPAPASADAPALRLSTSDPDARARAWIARLEDDGPADSGPGVCSWCIAELARRACDDPDGIRSLLRQVSTLDAAEATRSRAIAVVVALGRCESVEALEGLIELHDSGSLSPATRQTIPPALAQRRQPDLEVRKGPAFGSNHVGNHIYVDSPVEEPVVRAALLRWLRTALPPDLGPFAVALGPTAAVDADVRAEFVRVLSSEDSLRGVALLHLQFASAANAQVASMALDAALRASDPHVLRAGVMTATANRDAGPLRNVLAYVSDPAVPDDRRLAAYQGVSGVPGRDSEAATALAALLESAVAWAARHPEVEVEQWVEMRPKAVPRVVRVSTHLRLASTFRDIYATAEDPAVRATVVAFVLHALERSPTFLRRFREHAEPLGKDVAAALAGADVSSSVLQSLATFFAQNGGQSAVFDAIRASAERLTKWDRESVEAKLRALGK